MNAECDSDQDPDMARFNKLFPKWFNAVMPDLCGLFAVLFSIISPLTHMLLICLKMNHDYDDRVRLSVRSGHIVEAFEMTSARVFTFDEFEGFCKSTYSEMMEKSRDYATNPDDVVLRYIYVIRVTIEKNSHDYKDFVLDTQLNKAELNNIASGISIIQRAAMSADMSWFVESFKVRMQKHLEMVLVSYLQI